MRRVWRPPCPARPNRSKLCVLSSGSKLGDPPRRHRTGRRAPEGLAPMHKESSDLRAAGSRRLERAVVLVLLSEDDGQRTWSRPELRDGMGLEEGELELALQGLLDA